MKFKGQSIDFSCPKVMGVINVTPDSFYDGGRIKDDRMLLLQVEKMLNEGADFLDVGGYSSRPGASFVSLEDERTRVLPAINLVVKRFPKALISVDTFRAEVASEAVSAGAAFVNDISAGDDDPHMFSTISNLGVPYVAMHKQGHFETMQKNPSYEDVVSEIFDYLSKKISSLRSAGVENVIVDPGFGFGKKLEHNYSLLKHLGTFKKLEAPLLVGISRKSMIQKTVNCSADEALYGTIAANTVAILNGADILRVHDVLPAKHAILVADKVKVAK